MRFGANKKFISKMQEKGWSFLQLSERLKMDGVEISHKTLFQYADGRRNPNKSEQKAIAKALKCLVSDIF